MQKRRDAEKIRNFALIRACLVSVGPLFVFFVCFVGSLSLFNF
jgi:hypothetical protein